MAPLDSYSGITICLSFYGTSRVYSYCPDVTINNEPFDSQKRPSVDLTLSTKIQCGSLPYLPYLKSHSPYGRFPKFLGLIDVPWYVYTTFFF